MCSRISCEIPANVCRRSSRLNIVLVPGCLLTLMWSCRLWVRLLQRIWGLTSGDYFNVVSERFDRHADTSKNNRDVSKAETTRLLLLLLMLMLLRSSWLSIPLIWVWMWLTGSEMSAQRTEELWPQAWNRLRANNHLCSTSSQGIFLLLFIKY